MKANRKFLDYEDEASSITIIVFVVIAFVIGSTLITTVAINTWSAQNNTSVGLVPGGTDLIGLWPLMFVIIPIVWVVRKFTG